MNLYYFLSIVHKLPKSNFVVAVDSLNEAEQYRPDYGHSIITFLEEHLPLFPDFLKIVVTCRTQDQKLLARFPLHQIMLEGDNENLMRDAENYINHRISTASSLQNLTLSGMYTCKLTPEL